MSDQQHGASPRRGEQHEDALTDDALTDDALTGDGLVGAGPTLGEARRLALLQDLVLFCVAFSAGAAFYAVVGLLGDTSAWGVGLSDDLVLSGIVAGELFLLWNNGLRQGLRGHSIGKHQVGLCVVDRGTGRPVGALRGLVRGLVLVLLVDLALAALPLGLPTVLRRGTPDSWHVGGVTYLAVLVLLMPLVLGLRTTVLDAVARTQVVPADGPGSVTSGGRRRALVVLDVLGVLGVLALAITYIASYWSLIGTFPRFW